MARTGAGRTSDSGSAARPAPKEGPSQHEPPQTSAPLDMISHGEAVATARDARRANARVDEQRAILTPLIKALRKRRAAVMSTYKLQRESLERISRVDWTRLIPAWGPDAARGMGPLVIEAERLLSTMRTWLNGCDRLLDDAEPMLTRAMDDQTLAERRAPLERMGAQPGMDYDEECAIFARRLNWLIDMATTYHLAHRGEEPDAVTTIPRPSHVPSPKRGPEGAVFPGFADVSKPKQQTVAE